MFFSMSHRETLINFCTCPKCSKLDNDTTGTETILNYKGVVYGSIVLIISSKSVYYFIRFYIYTVNGVRFDKLIFMRVL